MRSLKYPFRVYCCNLESIRIPDTMKKMIVLIEPNCITNEFIISSITSFDFRIYHAGKRECDQTIIEIVMKRIVSISW